MALAVTSQHLITNDIDILQLCLANSDLVEPAGSGSTDFTDFVSHGQSSMTIGGRRT